MTMRELTLGGDVRMELRLGPDGLFRGLGDIRVRGVPLRHAAVPLRFQLDTPDGMLYTQLRLRKDVAGQNDFGWWADEPDMISEMNIDLGGFTRSAADSARLQFQAMASRGMIFFSQAGEQGGFLTREPGIPDWWQRNLALFNRAEPFMRGIRRLLPDRAGVVWHSEAGRCVWTFKDAEVPVAPGETVAAVNGKAAAPVDSKVALSAEGVYQIGCY